MPLFSPATRALVRSLLIGALLSVGASPAAAQGPASEGQNLGLIIRGLTFEGNKRYDDELLATVIATTQSGWAARWPSPSRWWQSAGGWR